MHNPIDTTLGVSIVICCHNSAERLPETLRHLKLQRVSSNIPWEVIVVDNASTDQTAKTAFEIWAGFPGTPLKVTHEPIPGLSNARLRGLKEAQYEFISFVDDDNRVAPDWVENAFEIMLEHPEAGACGGKSEGVFEIPPPIWYQDFYSRIAVGEQSTVEGDITELRGWLWGAGLTLRKQALQDILEKNQSLMLSGRKGNALTYGEDNEICYILRIHGWRLYYSSKLTLKHYIPSTRISWDYFVRMVLQNGYPEVVISRYKQYFKDPDLRNKTGYLRIWLSAVYSWGSQLRRKKKFTAPINHPGAKDYLELLNLKERLKTLIRMGPIGLYSIDRRISNWRA